MLLLIAITLPATALAETSPYVCPTCGEEFLIEAALVNHMNEEHGVKIQIEGDYPEYHPVIVTVVEHLPATYYTCPLTGRCFYTEAELCCWLENK